MTLGDLIALAYDVALLVCAGDAAAVLAAWLIGLVRGGAWGEA